MKWKIYALFLVSRFVNGFFIPDSMRVDVIRKTIDTIDDKIHNLIYLRLKCAEQLKGKKSKIRDPIREVSIIARLQDKEQLDPVMIKNIWKVLFKESYRVQNEDEVIHPTQKYTKEKNEETKEEKEETKEENEETKKENENSDGLIN